MQGCRIGVSPGHHGLIELDDYVGIEEPVLSHEGFQGVSLHKLHGVSKLGMGGESWNVIEVLIVKVLAIAI